MNSNVPTITESRNVFALYNLDYVDGHYIDQGTGVNRDEVVAMYSRMKFGSIPDTLFFAKEMAKKYLGLLEDPSSGVTKLFVEVGQNGQNVIIFAPGYRNVESASNRMIEAFSDLVNIELAKRNLPTIIVNKLTRMGSNPANYATLSAVERQLIPPKTQSVSPDKNLFDLGVHVFFGDDVKITGTTANIHREECLRAGAKSFSEVYAVALDPKVTYSNPEIEDALNGAVISGGLDENVIRIFSHPDFKPVQRMLRLVLGTENRDILYDFLLKSTNIPDKALVRLYIAALKNDYGQNPKYKNSMPFLVNSVKRRGLANESGLPIDLSLI